MNAIPIPVQAVVELFETTFSEVRFADVDTKTLAHAAAGVRELAAVVASAQVALDNAGRALQERQDALLQQAHRAMAYARVYAENDDALTQRLNAIALPRAPRRSRPGEDAAPLQLATEPLPAPRGRPRKIRGAEPVGAEDTSTAE
jgi:hypothetical protein